MSGDRFEHGPPKTLWMHVCAVWRKGRARRRVSLYLLAAILLVVLLGVQIVHVREDPRKFAFFLSVNFIFFFVVLWRAIVECMEIVRDNLKERESLYRSTLGDRDFAEELGRRVAEQKGPDDHRAETGGTSLKI